MRKIVHGVILVFLISYTSFGQETEIKSTDQYQMTDQTEAITLELIAVFNDAIDAPTEFNEYVKPYIENNSFPEKGNTTKKEYDALIKVWIESNSALIDDFRKDRQEAHDKLYGPRKKG